MTPSEYEKLKRAADDHAKSAERKRGELTHLESELKKEFGDGEPQKVLNRLEKEKEEKEKLLKVELEKFNRKHPGVLEE